MSIHKSLVLFSLASLSLWGDDYTWTSSSNENWDDTSAWTSVSGEYPMTSADEATLGTGTGTTVTVDGMFAVGQINFTGAHAYTIAAVAGDYLTIGGSNFSNTITDTGTLAQTISCPLILGQSIAINQNASATLTLSGGISAGSPSYNVTLNGTGVVQLQGTSNTYSGITQISSGTLQAGTAGTFAPSSNYVVNGTLDLNSLNNSIATLSGTGSVTLETATLTITNGSNGGQFSGVISGSTSTTGQLILNAPQMGSLLTLSGANTYGGGTTITAGTLQMSGAGQLNSTAPITVNGIFDIEDSTAASVQIGPLTGSGSISLGDNTLQLNQTTSTAFNGVISGTGMGGNVNFVGAGTLTLGGNNLYGGTTTIGAGAVLVNATGVSNAFAPGSTYIVNGTLNLNGQVDTITSLSGTGTGVVSLGSGTLTITNNDPSTTYAGQITGTGGQLTLTGGTLVLTGANTSTYSGATTLSNATLQAGAIGAFSPNSAVTLQTGSQLNLATFTNTIPSLSGVSASSVNIGTGATLSITGGGNYAGVIQGSTGGSLALLGGTMVLSGGNTYTGSTTITGSTLQLTSGGSIATSSGVTMVGGTFDISQITSATSINNLSGSGSVLLGNNQLTVNMNNTETFSGNIQGTGTGVGGSLIIAGTNALTLSGDNTYGGTTTVSSSARLNAGSTTALAPASNFVVAGILDLAGNSNTINMLSNTMAGQGTVTSSTGAATLTISNGGTFSGAGVTGTLGLTLVNGTFTLGTGGGVNTYSGTTTVDTNAILVADAATALSANSSLALAGTLNLNNNSNTINALSGSGTVETGTSGTVKALTINTGGNFTGQITGTGGLTLAGGTLILTPSLPTNPNNYSGATTISSSVSAATLQAGEANAFSSSSAVNLTNANSVLSLNGFNNTIYTLTGIAGSSVTLSGTGGGILTIAGSPATTFAGSITDTGTPNCGGLTINAGSNLTLSATTGSPNTYCGPTTVNGNLEITGTGGVSGGLSANSPVTVSSTGTLSLFAAATASSYTQATGGALDINFQTGAIGELTATGNISIAGALNVTAQATIPPETGTYTLLTTTAALSGRFGSFTTAGFPPTPTPLLSYSTTAVTLYFGTNTPTWTFPGNGSWGQATNWSTGIVPGGSNQNDTATFGPLAPGAITVTLANPGGTAAEAFTLFQLNFNSATTQYTITEFPGATGNTSSITFDSNPTGGNPSINVLLGSSFINAPLILNQNTNLDLSDGATLTLNPLTTLNSAVTANFPAGNETFTITQVGPLGTGLLVNNTTLTPFSINVTSATVQNNDAITPVSALTIGAGAGQFATVNNVGVNALLGPTATGGTVIVGGTGTTTIVNNGASAFFGPSGAAGTFTIQGTGTTTVTNSGLNSRMGTPGTSGNVNVTAGVVNNNLGALFSAGPGGVFTISGGTINNDLTSTIGATNQNIVFTGGTLSSTGNVAAFSYTQTAPAVLQLNLTSLDTIFGNVQASGTANVGGTLVVDALPGSVKVGDTVDLIYAVKGVTGTYPTVDFLNFPASVIPEIVYIPNAVVLEIAPTITSSAAGSLAEVSFVSVNETNIEIEREMHSLQERLLEKKKKKKKKHGETAFLTAAADPIADVNTNRQERYLAERTVEKEEINSTRFYIGPTASLGDFKTVSLSQAGFDYNSAGVLTGIDNAFNDWGVGGAGVYQSLSADIDHHAGNFKVHHAHVSAYTVYVPDSLQYLAVDAIAGYGYEWYDIRRVAGLTLSRIKTKGNTRGMEADALLGCEYMFVNDQFQAMPEHVMITPFVNLQYIWVKINGYNEHHAGVFGLHFGEQCVRSLRSTLAVRFEYKVECKNVTFKPEIDIGWQREFMDHNRHIHFSTLSLPVTQHLTNTVQGAGRDTFWAGVDFLFTIYKVFELEMSYDFQWNSLYQNNAFYLGVGGNF